MTNPIMALELLRAELLGVKNGLISSGAPTIPIQNEVGNYVFLAGSRWYYVLPSKAGVFDQGAEYVPTNFSIPDQDILDNFRFCWERISNRGNPSPMPGVGLST